LPFENRPKAKQSKLTHLLYISVVGKGRYGVPVYGWKCFDYVLKQNPLLHTTVESVVKQELK
jgi:hypothetical protein